MNPFPAEQFLYIQNNKLQSKGNYNAESNYASRIGIPCLRQLVYARTRGKEAIPRDEISVANIEEGIDQEKAVIRWLDVLGYEFILSQEKFEMSESLIHGKIDGVIISREKGIEIGKWAAEIKSVQPEDWERLNTMQDIYNSEKSWHHAWYAQLQLAIHQKLNLRGYGPFGVLLLKDKTRKRIKPISFSYDAEEIARCIEKGIEINQHVADGTLPERISYTSGHCKWCDYRLICNPEEIFKAGKNIQDAEFLAKLREYHDLKETSSKVTKLWEHIKEVLRGVQYAVCGEFQIEGKERKGGGWILTITKVFSPSVEELSPNPCPGERVYNILAKQIESATTMEQLLSCKEPAKAAKNNKSITPSQVKSLEEIFIKSYKKFIRKSMPKPRAIYSNSKKGK